MRRINGPGDRDDLVAVTLAVNGGRNGYAERRALLIKAKRALAAQPAEAATPREATRAPQAASAAGPAPTHRVSAGRLNLRREPRSDRPNQIATLPQGTRVQSLGAPDAKGWVQVRVMLSGALRAGFVASEYLTPLPPGASFAIEAETLAGLVLPPALLSQGKAESARSQSSHRLYPLGEASRPKVNGSAPETLAKQLLECLAWLDCEEHAHSRYRAPKGGSVASTYACDYCELAGVYLPRVWWTPESLVGIAEERKLEVELNRSVRELSTKGLYDWLEDHGSACGWHCEIEAIEIQAAANAGEVCLIVAMSSDLSRAGQIAAVVPEHEGCEATRDRAGDVLRPVESHCGGAKNLRCGKSASAWWLTDRYRAYAFWRHPLGEDA